MHGGLVHNAHPFRSAKLTRRAQRQQVDARRACVSGVYMYTNILLNTTHGLRQTTRAASGGITDAAEASRVAGTWGRPAIVAGPLATAAPACPSWASTSSACRPNPHRQRPAIARRRLLLTKYGKSSY